jgi:hypothetical protein
MQHPLSGFWKFAGTDFERYILPIIPAGAKLKDGSKINPGQLGKIPGMWLSDERVWIGFKDWSKNYVYARAFYLSRPSRNQTG